MGPLQGVTIIEIASIGPGPFAAMLLSDLGARVVRVDRADTVGGVGSAVSDPLLRGRRSVGIDLKHSQGVASVLRMVERSDGLIEGFRPGVAERLGIGPDPCFDRNPRLVYGRMTGWGQEGPLAETAGHDIDYIALAGVLSTIGSEGGPPVPPLNLVGDFGGGGMLLALGMVAGLFEATRSGLGQVVDAAMVDGSALLATMIHGLRAIGMWSDRRGTNLLDGGAPFYGVYETADGGHVAVGAIEPPFFEELVQGLGLAVEDLPHRLDTGQWPELRERLQAVFASRTRDEWVEIFAGSDACVAPVLSLGEAPYHPHNRARRTFVEISGVTQPAPAPRFSRTPPEIAAPPSPPGRHTSQILHEFGFSAAEIEELRDVGAVR